MCATQYGNGRRRPSADGFLSVQGEGNLDLSKNTVSYTCSGNKAELSNGYVTCPLTKAS
ncbi:hypothetical protein [Catellatospora sp. NPDC049133]|uniref:hypothetical protein n=1 Tax=Catellatospora sp. NPDC049133 TaxID=3155499 RepID=UPI0033CEBE97